MELTNGIIILFERFENIAVSYPLIIALTSFGGLCALAHLLDCRTTEPGLQFYTGNFLSTANIRGKGGAVYADRSGFCLETQHFPNAMQHPHFPSVVLPAGDLYRSVTEYRFDIN